MRSPKRWIRGALLLALLTAASLARAGDVESRAAADALFREAVQLAEAGKYDQSIQKFQASYELDPARGTLQGLAMAEEKAGRVLDALTHFRQLLEAAQRAGDKAREAVAQEHLDALRPRVPSLTIALGGDVPPDTRVFLDDRKLPAGAIGSALPINPGDHRVVAKTSDGRTFSRMVGVSEGGRAKVEISWRTPEPEAEKPPPAAPPLPPAEPERRGLDLSTVGLVIGAVGAVTVGVGAYMWIDSGEDYDALENRCPDKQCPPDEQERIDSGRAKERWSRVALIAGGVAIAGGVTLFVIGSGRKSEPAVSGVAGPSTLVLRGRF